MIYLVVFALARGEDSCWKYSCKPSEVDLDPNTCVYPDEESETYYLQECPSGSECKFKSFSPRRAVSCGLTQLPILKSYPGESCFSFVDCVYGICEDKICFGQSEGESCHDMKACNPGLRCDKICKKLLSEGEEGCSSDYDCETHLACNQNVCVPYFSVGNSDSINSNSTFSSLVLVCQSGFARDNLCEPAPISNSSLPVLCENSLDCQGTNGNAIENTECECGMNAQGDKYCHLHPGDLGAENFKNAVREVFADGFASDCNTARRFSQNCWDLYRGQDLYAEFMRAYLMYTQYPLWIDNDSCVNSMFFEPVVNYAGALSAIAILLFS